MFRSYVNQTIDFSTNLLADTYMMRALVFWEAKFIAVFMECYEAYLEPYQIFKMKCFAKILNALEPLTITAKCSI